MWLPRAGWGNAAAIPLRWPVPAEPAPGLTMLVDASSLIYRAFFSTPIEVTAPGGRPVNAAHGFLGMLARLVSDFDPASLACATDEDWRPAWRVELLASYKTHRLAAPGAAPPANPEDQIPLIAEVLGLCGVAVVGAPDYEAEDVIGALVPRAPGDVVIVSGDRDLFQLVRDPLVRVLYPRRGVSDLLVVDEAEITRRFGIPGRAYWDFAVLRGDPSDGLPGVRGIGEKTASALVARYGSLERILEAAMGGPAGPLGKVAASLDYVDRAARVTLITGDCPIGDPDIARPRGEHDPRLEEVAAGYGLLGPVRRLLAALAGR